MLFSLVSSGSNAHGQLAIGTTDDTHTFSSCTFYDGDSRKCSISEKIIHIASGGNHTLLLSEYIQEDTGLIMKSLWGCGNGGSGQLGNCGRDEDATVFRRINLQLAEYGLEGYQPRLICCSWETSYVVLSSERKPDVLLSMGSNDFGDLGVGRGTSVHAKLFQTVQFNHCLEVDGLALDGVYLQVISISTGQHHVIVQLHVQLRDESRRTLIIGWGAARHGQLGDTSTLNKNTPFFSLPKIIEVPHHPNDPVVQIALGHQHSVLLHESGRLTELGSNKKSQIAGLDEFRNVSFVGCTWNGTYVVDACGTLYATGSHSKGQLGRSPPSASIHPHPVEFPFRITSARCLSGIACGSEHILVLKTESGFTPEVWGWGWNEHGNLGLGSTMDVHTPLKLWPQEVDHVNRIATGIWAGCGTSWIALEKQSL
ncbi:regulator of chromosome condensation 1/beta-lactamase-inhibitor protein II [Lentinula detonsa]|uniref:Regulator of chromosome condensation 1/beta-lactamase-inhibitor protein II n=1 Tax=Lentinula detonsa TaxID=2804962 RepID=A0AA38PU38_9AGAR|nr:regulator of chromosome condensation 1/beta-lactamase-inhibitor protein II [Lentinula detonsa]